MDGEWTPVHDLLDELARRMCIEAELRTYFDSRPGRQDLHRRCRLATLLGALAADDPHFSAGPLLDGFDHRPLAISNRHYDLFACLAIDIVGDHPGADDVLDNIDRLRAAVVVDRDAPPID